MPKIANDAGSGTGSRSDITRIVGNEELKPNNSVKTSVRSWTAPVSAIARLIGPRNGIGVSPSENRVTSRSGTGGDSGSGARVRELRCRQGAIHPISLNVTGPNAA